MSSCDSCLIYCCLYVSKCGLRPIQTLTYHPQHATPRHATPRSVQMVKWCAFLGGNGSSSLVSLQYSNKVLALRESPLEHASSFLGQVRAQGLGRSGCSAGNNAGKWVPRLAVGRVGTLRFPLPILAGPWSAVLQGSLFPAPAFSTTVHNRKADAASGRLPRLVVINRTGHAPSIQFCGLLAPPTTACVAADAVHVASLISLLFINACCIRDVSPFSLLSCTA